MKCIVDWITFSINMLHILLFTILQDWGVLASGGYSIIQCIYKLSTV